MVSLVVKLLFSIIFSDINAQAVYKKHVNSISFLDVRIVEKNNELFITYLAADQYLDNNILYSTRAGLFTTNIRNGTTTLIVGQTNSSLIGYREGQGQQARFHLITSFVQTSRYDLLLLDNNNNRIRSVDRITSRSSLVSGSGRDSPVNGSLAEANFKQPDKIAMESAEKFYVTEPAVNSICVIDFTVNGGSVTHYMVQASYLNAVTFDITGHYLYIIAENEVMKMNPHTFHLTTVASFSDDPPTGQLPDGPFRQAGFTAATDAIFLDSHTLLVTNILDGRLRVVDLNGMVSSICKTNDLLNLLEMSAGDISECVLEPASSIARYNRTTLVVGTSGGIGALHVEVARNENRKSSDAMMLECSECFMWIFSLIAYSLQKIRLTGTMPSLSDIIVV